MYEGKTRTLFARYAIPQMIWLLFNSIYLIVDGVFIGNRLGRDAMAAAAVAVPLIEILIALAMAVASGAGIMISNRLGRKDMKEARHTFTLGVAVLTAMGLMIAVFGNLFLDQLTGLLGATGEIHREAATYLRYIISFSPFLLLSFLFGGLARNDGKPRLAMFALAFGSVSNIVLDYVFMYPMNMGIAGAALATALGPIFSLLILLPHFLLKKGHLYFVKIKGLLRGAKQIFALGFPAFIMEFTIGIVTFAYNFAIVRNGYGETGLAAYLMIGYLMLIILTVFLGMAEGLQPVFSYLSGAGEEERARVLLSFSVKVFIAAGALCFFAIALFARSFMTVFTPGDAQLIHFAHQKSLLYFCGFVFAGYNILMISYWQSMKRTKAALFVSLLRSILLPPMLLFGLPLCFGKEAIWICHSLCEALTACFVSIYVHRRP